MLFPYQLFFHHLNHFYFLLTLIKHLLLHINQFLIINIFQYPEMISFFKKKTFFIYFFKKKTSFVES